MQIEVDVISAIFTFLDVRHCLFGADEHKALFLLVLMSEVPALANEILDGRISGRVVIDVDA